MAQIALRKTANENKVEYPKAAEVLEKNTYMDDICVSVDTKQEARELTDRSTPIKPQRNNLVVLVWVRLGIYPEIVHIFAIKFIYPSYFSWPTLAIIVKNEK